MTGYTVHTGSNDKFRDGWDSIFGGKKKTTNKKSSTNKASGDKASAKKKAVKKKAAKKKIAAKSKKKTKK